MPAGVIAGAALIRVLGGTWRIERQDLVAYDHEIARGARCIFAFWHARMLPLVYTHRGRGIAVLVSRHRDGEWIARIIERLGFATARGSSTRGGEAGTLEMLTFAERGGLLAVTPDGPRGPAERVKAGLVFLASKSGLPVVPVATASNRADVMRSWDGFRVPHPFARVVVSYGTPIHVPRDLGRDGIESFRLRIEEAIKALTRTVGERAGEAA
jgi:lysophospholipid acyltransferase (LPLAT)-like uncharacterized protein